MHNVRSTWRACEDDQGELSKADSGTYRADVPHAIINIGKGVAVVFLVVIYR